MAGTERRCVGKGFEGVEPARVVTGEKKDAQVLGLGAGQRPRAQDPGEDRRDV